MSSLRSALKPLRLLDTISDDVLTLDSLETLDIFLTNLLKVILNRERGLITALLLTLSHLDIPYVSQRFN